MGRPNPASMSPEVQRELTYDINVVARQLEQLHPEIWKRMNTKSIDSPAGYYSSKALAVALTGAIVETEFALKNVRPLESNVGFITGRMEEHDFPLYYVSAPLLQALRKTHPPESMKWEDIKLPYPALAFMLPRGALQEPQEFGGKDIVFVGVCSLPKGFTPVVPGTACRLPSIPDYSRISVFWGVAPGCIIVHDTTFPTSHPLEPLADWIDERTEQKDPNFYGPTGKFSAYVCGIVANLILVMEARKELVTPGKRVYKNPREGRPDVWSPTFIGRNYTILREQSADPKSHFTELGWRAGHMKRQHWGTGNAQVKTIWIDPYIAFTRGLKNLK